LDDKGAKSETMVTPAMRDAVGREYRWMTSYPIAASDIRRWAVAVYYPEPPPPLYWDEAYAATTRWGGIVAPEEFNPFAWMRAAPQGYVGRQWPWPEAELGIEPPRTRANIVTGMEAEHTTTRMRPGDVIRSTTRLAKYEERVGRLGLMLFTTTEERWFNQNDELVRIGRLTIIRYR
jgi:hypothetical protein